MHIFQIRWSLEQAALILKITAATPGTNNSDLNKNLQTQLIAKMVDIIHFAEKFQGKPIDAPPIIPKEQDKVIVASAIFFNSLVEIDTFKKELPSILNKE